MASASLSFSEIGQQGPRSVECDDKHVVQAPTPTGDECHGDARSAKCARLVERARNVGKNYKGTRPSLPPTQSQLETLRWLASNIIERGCSPSNRETMVHFGLRSSYAVFCRLTWLAIKGLIELGPKQTGRTVTITERGWELLGGRERFAEARVKPSALPATGFVMPPSMKCKGCGRVFFGDSWRAHRRCSPDDIAAIQLGK